MVMVLKSFPDRIIGVSLPSQIRTMINHHVWISVWREYWVRVIKLWNNVPCPLFRKKTCFHFVMLPQHFISSATMEIAVHCSCVDEKFPVSLNSALWYMVGSCNVRNSLSWSHFNDVLAEPLRISVSQRGNLAEHPFLCNLKDRQMVRNVNHSSSCWSSSLNKPRIFCQRRAMLWLGSGWVGGWVVGWRRVGWGADGASRATVTCTLKRGQECACARSERAHCSSLVLIASPLYTLQSAI